MKNKFLALVLATIMLALSVKGVMAQERCESVYGGGEVCYKGETLIDKMVGNPATGNYVDNLGATDPKFRAGQEVVFRLTVKNTGTNEIDRVEVRDTLPSYLEYISGPEGSDIENVSYDSGSRVLRFDVRDLDVNESRDFYVRARVVSEGNLPEGTVCVVNQVEAKANDITQRDTAQLCISRAVLGVAVMPVTGVNDGLMLLAEALGLTTLGGLTLKLVKRGK